MKSYNWPSRLRWKTCLNLFATLYFLLALFLVPSFASLTIEEERKIGEEFYQRLLRTGLVIPNERLNRYLNSVGNRLLSAGTPVPFEFRFFLLRSNAVNAFATPGGFVYVNMGLVNLTENEAQLASVLAHEIAHVNSRHIASMLEKTQKINVATMAAIIAGALLGGGGDLTAAAASFSLAAGSMMQLKYSREHEEEADRIGLAILSAAGYSSLAALDFLKNMRKSDFFSTNLPSYFLTHPGIDERIRYIENLLHSSYPPRGKLEIIGNFARIKTIMALEGEDNLKTQRHFLANLQKSPNSVDNLYGLAVTQKRLGAFSEALENFQKALSLSPDDPDIMTDMAITLFNAGRLEEAISLLNRTLIIDPENSQAITFLGRAYFNHGQYRRAIDTLQAGLKLNFVKDADYYLLLGSAHGRLNQLGESHFYFGLSFKLKGRPPISLHHFQEALKFLPKDSALFSEAQKEIEAIREAEKLKKRGDGKASLRDQR